MTGDIKHLPDPQPDIANLSPRELSSNQEARVVPWMAGERKLAVSWIAPPYKLYAKKLQASRGPVQQFFDNVGIAPPSIGAYLLNKQSDASRSTSVYYFGSLAGVVCAGPVDELVAVLMNGGTVWPTTEKWADSVIDMPVATYQRTANSARLEFIGPHGLHSNNKFVLRAMNDASFNEAAATTITHVNSLVIRYANAGANVGKTTATSGFLTKVVHYIAGDLVADGSSIWECILDHDGLPSRRPPNGTYWTAYSVLRGASANPYPFTVDQIGLGYFYWGTSTQVLDTAGEQLLSANGHPPYRHQAVLVLKDWLFGSTRNAAPNIEVIVRRAPAQAIIGGGSASLADNQANPLGAYADLLTDQIFGIGRSATLPDATTWQAVADDLAGAADRTYLSPILDKAIAFRAFTAQLMAYYDGWLRFSGQGKIEAGRFLHGEAPPAFDATTTIDYNDLIAEIEWDGDGWPGTFNECVTRFEDRARAFKPAAMRAVSSLNRDIVGEPRGARLERPWITRELQADLHSAEWIKINSQPRLSGTLAVRSEKAAIIIQGKLFLLTHDALAFSVVCRCIEKRKAAPPSGKVLLRFENERGTAPVPYRATPIAVGGTVLPRAGKVDLYQLVQPPPALVASDDFTVAVLAARTSELSHGVKLWLQKDDGSLFIELGSQVFFAINGTLAQDYNAPVDSICTYTQRTANVTTVETNTHFLSTGMSVAIEGFETYSDFNDPGVQVTVIDATHFSYPNPGANTGVIVADGGFWTFLNDDDSETLQFTPADFTLQADLDRIFDTQSEDAINDNTLLVWLFDADDPTVFEIATLKAIRLDAGVYKLKVRRARFATKHTSFTAADTSCWIGFRRDLIPYAQARFSQYAQSGLAATFRLQAFTAYEFADLSDPDVCPDIAFTFADPFAPVAIWTLLQKNGVDIASFAGTFLPTDVFTFGMQFTDANADLTEGKLVARLGTTELTLWAQSFALSEQQLKTTSFSIATEGAWRVFAIAKDASGRVKEYELEPVGGGAAVQLTIKPAGSTTVATPVANPAGGSTTTTSFHVTMTCATAGATIKVQVVAYGAAPGAWTTYSGTITVPASYSGRTLYAYALKAGLTDSAVVRYDFWKESNL